MIWILLSLVFFLILNMAVNLFGLIAMAINVYIMSIVHFVTRQHIQLTIDIGHAGYSDAMYSISNFPSVNTYITKSYTYAVLILLSMLRAFSKLSLSCFSVASCLILSIMISKWASLSWKKNQMDELNSKVLKLEGGKTHRACIIAYIHCYILSDK